MFNTKARFLVRTQDHLKEISRVHLKQQVKSTHLPKREATPNKQEQPQHGPTKLPIVISKNMHMTSDNIIQFQCYT